MRSDWNWNACWEWTRQKQRNNERDREKCVQSIEETQKPREHSNALNRSWNISVNRVRWVATTGSNSILDFADYMYRDFDIYRFSRIAILPPNTTPHTQIRVQQCASCSFSSFRNCLSFSLFWFFRFWFNAIVHTMDIFYTQFVTNNLKRVQFGRNSHNRLWDLLQIWSTNQQHSLIIAITLNCELDCVDRLEFIIEFRTKSGRWMNSSWIKYARV